MRKIFLFFFVFYLLIFNGCASWQIKDMVKSATSGLDIFNEQKKDLLNKIIGNIDAFLSFNNQFSDCKLIENSDKQILENIKIKLQQSYDKFFNTNGSYFIQHQSILAKIQAVKEKIQPKSGESMLDVHSMIYNKRETFLNEIQIPTYEGIDLYLKLINDIQPQMEKFHSVLEKLNNEVNNIRTKKQFIDNELTAKENDLIRIAKEKNYTLDAVKEMYCIHLLSQIKNAKKIYECKILFFNFYESYIKNLVSVFNDYIEEIVQLMEKSFKLISLYGGIYFPFDVFDIENDDRTINKLINTLTDLLNFKNQFISNLNVVVHITGHSSILSPSYNMSGNIAYNNYLAEKRAKSVYKKFQQKVKNFNNRITY